MDSAENRPAGDFNPYRPPHSFDSYPAERFEAVAQPRRAILRPLILYILCWVSTYWAGSLGFNLPERGIIYASCVMLILTCHELGHFFQALRYRVHAGFPNFIPMPVGSLGTMGAIIVMDARIPNRKALFDIGITGPLAGLVPTLICCVVGLMKSEIILANAGIGRSLGEPLVFKFLIYCIYGPLQQNQDVLLHPMAFAGWVGLLITALNLFPIGQLDGGHVLYAIFRRGSYPVAGTVLVLAIVGMALTNNWGWSLMVVLLLVFGPFHPPTADDDAPLGIGRTILGLLTLCFVVIGFTPSPGI